MANVFTSFYEETFGQVEDRLKKYYVAGKLAGRVAEGGLNGGRYYQYAADPDVYANRTANYTDVGFNSVTPTETVMDAMQHKYQYSFRVDMRDKNTLRRWPAFMASKAADAVKQMTLQSDGDFLGETYSSANNYFDNADLGGSAGAITLNAGNAIETFSGALGKLQNIAGPSGSEYALVITPVQLAKLRQAKVANGWRVADSLLEESSNNEVVSDFMGMRVFLSSALTHTYAIPYANGTDFSNSTTITINGVVFKATTSSVATYNDFLVGTNADTSATALVGLLNAPTTTDANGYKVGDVEDTNDTRRLNLAKINGISASVDTTNNIITIVSKRGPATITSTLSGATSVGTGVVHNYLGQVGVIEMASGTPLTNVTREEPQQPTTNFMSFWDYGIASQYFAKSRILDVRCFV